MFGNKCKARVDVLSSQCMYVIGYLVYRNGRKPSSIIDVCMYVCMLYDV
jgi:hypothetical protein